MNKQRDVSHIYFGWWTVIVTGIISGLGIGFYSYCISALFKPIAMDLGLTRAVTSGASAIGITVGSLLAPLTGWFIDRFGPKPAILSGLILIITGLSLMSIITSTWEFYIYWGLIAGVGAHIGMTMVIDKALSNWFVRKIGLAMGTKFALIGLVSAVSLPFVSWLVLRVGWRMTCLIWSAILLIGVPFVVAFVRNKRPEFYGLLPDGDGVSPQSTVPPGTTLKRGSWKDQDKKPGEFSLRHALKTGAFWILTATSATQFFVTTGFNTHCIPLLTEMGIDQIVAGIMMGYMIVFTIPSRFIMGLIVDRIRTERLHFLMVLPFFFFFIGIGIFLIHSSSFTTYFLLALYGIAHGLPAPIYVVMVSRYFGRKAFGSILGFTFACVAPAALVSPILTGWVFDTTGRYTAALILFASAALLNIILLFFLRVPTLQKRSALNDH